MRVIKDADVRENEILDAATILFAEKGADHTSVADIMTAVGIAKGTLYHHFKSKEEIMDALIERQTSVLLKKAKMAAGDQSMPVNERMLRTVLALHMDTEQTEGREMIRHLHEPQNALMHEKTKRVIFRQVPAIMAGIVEDGIAHGIFDAPYPLESMEMALCYLDVMLDDNILKLGKTQRSEKIRAFLCLLERLLGAESGELTELEAAFQASESKSSI